MASEYYLSRQTDRPPLWIRKLRSQLGGVEDGVAKPKVRVSSSLFSPPSPMQFLSLSVVLVVDRATVAFDFSSRLSSRRLSLATPFVTR